MGARNVYRFAPANDSFIDVADFASPQALAEHLIAVANDAERYAALHQWRRRPIEARFVALAHESMNSVACRVCEMVHDDVGDEGGRRSRSELRRRATKDENFETRNRQENP